MQKIKRLLSDKAERMELIRYVVAGGLTTVLSILISYGCYILFSDDHTINGANTQQVMLGNIISWIVSVLFAFWINRRMVFRVSGEGRRNVLKELAQFASARVISLLVFEEGMAALLSAVGVSNLINRLIVLVFVTVFNYVASKFWIFAKKPEEAPEESAEEPESRP